MYDLMLVIIGLCSTSTSDNSVCTVEPPCDRIVCDIDGKNMMDAVFQFNFSCVNITSVHYAGADTHLMIVTETGEELCSHNGSDSVLMCNQTSECITSLTINMNPGRDAQIVFFTNSGMF